MPNSNPDPDEEQEKTAPDQPFFPARGACRFFLMREKIQDLWFWGRGFRCGGRRRCRFNRFGFSTLFKGKLHPVWLGKRGTDRFFGDGFRLGRRGFGVFAGDCAVGRGQSGCLGRRNRRRRGGRSRDRGWRRQAGGLGGRGRWCWRWQSGGLGNGCRGRGWWHWQAGGLGNGCQGRDRWHWQAGGLGRRNRGWNWRGRRFGGWNRGRSRQMDWRLPRG